MSQNESSVLAQPLPSEAEVARPVIEPDGATSPVEPAPAVPRSRFRELSGAAAGFDLAVLSDEDTPTAAEPPAASAEDPNGEPVGLPVPRDVAAAVALPDFCFPDSWDASVGIAVLPFGSQVSVPPDGHCLAYCLIAARNPAAWLAIERHGGGFICDKDLELTHANEARNLEGTVASIMAVAQASLHQAIDRNPEDCGSFIRALADVDQSLTALEAGSLPDEVALLFYAHVMGGRIVVDTMREGLRPFGRGKPVLQVRNFLLAGGQHHYELQQSWLTPPGPSPAVDAWSEADTNNACDGDDGEEHDDDLRGPQVSSRGINRRQR